MGESEAKMTFANFIKEKNLFLQTTKFRDPSIDTLPFPFLHFKEMEKKEVQATIQDIPNGTLLCIHHFYSHPRAISDYDEHLIVLGRLNDGKVLRELLGNGRYLLCFSIDGGNLCVLDCDEGELIQFHPQDKYRHRDYLPNSDLKRLSHVVNIDKDLYYLSSKSISFEWAVQSKNGPFFSNNFPEQTKILTSIMNNVSLIDWTDKDTFTKTTNDLSHLLSSHRGVGLPEQFLFSKYGFSML